MQNLQAQKLRILLANALVKDEQGLPLTVKEETLVAECYRRKNEKRRERSYVDSDGAVHISTTIDIEPMLDAIRAYGDFIDRHTERKFSQKLIGSVDPVTASNWSRECGEKIGTKAFAQFAMKRIKDDIDYRRFRVGGA